MTVETNNNQAQMGVDSTHEKQSTMELARDLDQSQKVIKSLQK